MSTAGQVGEGRATSSAFEAWGKETTNASAADRPSSKYLPVPNLRASRPDCCAGFRGAGVAVVEAAIGYEWLLSGLNKVLSPDFSSGLAHQLQTSMQGNPNSWYVSLANTILIPHAQICAVLAEVGELMVAFGLFAGAPLWLLGGQAKTRWAKLLSLSAIGALIGGILMSANYAVMSGDTLPGINAGNAFNEGLSIESMLTIIGLGLLAIHIVVHRARFRNAAGR